MPDNLPMPLFLAGLMLIGVLCQWLAWRVRLPAILFLLLVGIGLGPVSGVLDPDALLGDLLFPLVSLGVAVILFEGSLTLRLAEARGVQRIIRNLCTVGVLVTAGVLSLAAHYLAGLSWSLAFLFGAMGSVTGPTVVVPMLRSMKPSARIGSILRWEGILIDAIGALLAVLVYEAVLSVGASDPFLTFLRLIGAGTGLGLAGAGVLAFLLRRHWIPTYLENYFALALVLTVFAGANAIEHESGLVAVTVMGITLANTKGVNVSEILDFKEHLTVLLISMLFLLLAARMDLELVQALGWASLAVLAVAQFVARPLAVALSSIGTTVNLREGLLLAWVAPRGIVAAAISALFALQLVKSGVPEAEALVPLTFVLIIGTVVLQSATAKFVARLLGLSREDAQGVMIVGANRVATAVGKALKEQAIDVLLVDDNWEAVRDARMQGLSAWFGNPLSEQAELHLDLTGMTRLFLISRRSELNTLVYSRYRPDFGPKNIYALRFRSDEGEGPEVRQLSHELRAQELFGPEASWQKLASLLGQGGQIRVTKLTEAFDIDAFHGRHGRGALPLFAINPDGRLRVFSGQPSRQIGPGWKVGFLRQATSEDEKLKKAAERAEADAASQLPG